MLRSTEKFSSLFWICKQEWEAQVTKLVNDIGRFFVNKIDAIRSEIDGHDLDSTNVPNDEVVDDSCPFNTFHLLSDQRNLACQTSRIYDL